MISIIPLSSYNLVIFFSVHLKWIAVNLHPMFAIIFLSFNIANILLMENFIELQRLVVSRAVQLINVRLPLGWMSVQKHWKTLQKLRQ